MEMVAVAGGYLSKCCPVKEPALFIQETAILQFIMLLRLIL